ncbi:hypothetical protein LMG27952_05072 [Paraburkholderia hiiakae]|uniref:DUF3311 domain-containing protein n=1 Tax=Paraburkholderia hiiakae TaxID=1081782 RepID=A0ABN7I757_9BURK|nr:DUF3311 domain-containing protein [Paraburkholderia hiiakae]CAD6550809.1 hypothetical protein LMG27952_05072 [Paraburkholderia hiiakae]
MKKIDTLAAIPCILIFVGIFFGNRVTPFVLGVPFLLAWIMGCAVLTTIALLVIDRVSHSKYEEAAGDAT